MCLFTSFFLSISYDKIFKISYNTINEQIWFIYVVWYSHGCNASQLALDFRNFCLCLDKFNGFTYNLYRVEGF